MKKSGNIYKGNNSRGTGMLQRKLKLLFPLSSKIISLLLITIIGMAAFPGCDKIEGSRFDHTATIDTDYTFPADTTPDVYRVLVENYTGHTCGNCPEAERELYNVIVPNYGDKLVTLGVHANFFAETCPPHQLPKSAPPGSYSADYNTVAGNEWYNYFQLFSNPLGLINRVDFIAGNQIKTWNSWGGEIAGIINTTPLVKIRIHNSYSPSTRTLKTYSETKFLQPGSSAYKVNVVLSEDSIVSWQEDYQSPDTNIANYVHRHVLRGSINGSFGSPLNTTAVSQGTTFFRGYSTTLPADWNPAHMSVIVFVFDDATKEILNVMEERIQ